MKRIGARRAVILAGFILVVGGCETRSISNSGYRASGVGSGNPFYHGELTAYEVLGLDPARGASDAEIAQALSAKQRIAIPKGSAIMLVQSGAPFPDPGMVDELQRYYTVSSFTGEPVRQPAAPGQAPIPYSQLFRLAAAKGGYGTVIVTWGMIESASASTAAKGLSWLPVIGGVIPDETEHMRIRLMVAVIDVRSGQWESFTTAPIDGETMSNQHHRAAADQTQVETLKARAYKDAADRLVERYGL